MLVLMRGLVPDKSGSLEWTHRDVASSFVHPPGDNTAF